ncbi:LuxR C-terminal-related transcriptional regulator [Kitasatospora purpeofusca]|uniref:LuxR C-terminal-related transcriptional regulator n=1 Tax=Kitasatospora purpeofusca TaxID=67352 RepID=UPI002A5A3332|nr:LuxR C-terminal-related transcriptional regulator [Kitasatospora purpeofusca]MDY0809784.1 LuxR C-terminal-related transcriptional regulator [Kitasatospora purpeofusca]
MLTALGLDAVAESVYRAMLAHPGDGVTTLADRLSLVEPQVRTALDHLSELALLRPSADRPGFLRAVSPDVGMEILMARQQAELAAAQARIEASRAAAAQLIADYADLRPEANTPDVEQLVGLDRIRDRLSRFSNEAREEIMTFAPEGGQKPENIEAAKPLNRALADRGVRMRTVYLDSVRNSPHTVDYVNWLASLGGQVRTVPELPTRMIVVDRATAVIPVRSDDTAAGAVVLTGQGMLTALCALFETVWAGAQSLGATVQLDRNGLTAQERTAVALLADGHTDDAIAKRLGVSPRTARRIATDLMERLEARSRFQAGARAAQVGWLS